MNDQKPATQTPADSSPLSSGVTFGFRGCLSTLIGLILGAQIGAGLIILLLKGPSFLINGLGHHYSVSGDEDFIAWAIGGLPGAVYGTFLGVLVGAKRR